MSSAYHGLHYVISPTCSCRSTNRKRHRLPEAPHGGLEELPFLDGHLPTRAVVLRHLDLKRAQLVASGKPRQNHVRRECRQRNRFIEIMERRGAHQTVGRIHVPDGLAIENADAQPRDERHHLARQLLHTPLTRPDQEVVFASVRP